MTQAHAKGVAILAMPSPNVLRAPAVWITARNWALACEEVFGDAFVVTPERLIHVDELGAVIDNMLRASPVGGTSKGRSRFSLEARTLAKDIRTAARHLKASRWRAVRDHGDWASLDVALVWQHHDPFFRLGEVIAKRTNTPFVQFVDAPHVWEARRWGVRRPLWGRAIERFGERPQLLQADAVVCVSQGVADALRELGVDHGSAHVAPCTSAPDFARAVAAGPSVRPEFGIPADALVLGWAGSFRRFHAVEDLVGAFDRLSRELPHLWLLLVGDGPDRGRIQRLVMGLDAADRVAVTGSIPFSRMPATITAIDIAVVTARDAATFHYSPLKLREYRAAGRAIVAPEVGQIAETLTDGLDALLYPPGDVETLVSRVRTLARDPSLRSELGVRTQELELDTGGAVSQLRSVLQELERCE